MTGDASDQRLSSWSKLLSREAYSVFRCFRCAVCSVCVCVCVWVNRCDQSATVDNWEAQASAVVEVHRVLLIIVIVVVVTMVVHVSRWPDQRTQSVLTVSLSLFSVFFFFLFLLTAQFHFLAHPSFILGVAAFVCVDKRTTCVSIIDVDRSSWSLTFHCFLFVSFK